MDRHKHLCIVLFAAMLCGVPLRAAAYSGVNISGTFQTNLTSISANEWQGIGYVPTNITSASLLFNGTGPTETLGDTNQPWSDLPTFATAEVTNNPITFGPTNSGYFVFYLDEQTQAYGAQRCTQYVNFNDWSGVDDFVTNVVNSWMLSNARTTTNITETYAVYEGKSFILNDAGEQPFLLSPLIAAGIGEVSFWYRSREPNDNPKGAFTVEISVDAASWRSVATVLKAPSTYTHMRIPLADTTYRYVRIVATTNTPRAQLCFDEISIAEPSHIVTFSGHSRTPPSPSVLDQVEISIDITPGTHATNYLPRIRYRAGTGGAFDYVSMSNTSGNTYKGSIPGGAIGTMQYFVECLVPAAGRESYASSYYPTDGSLAPLSYVNADDAYVMTFEAWPGRPIYTEGVYTNTDAEGWIVSAAAIPNFFSRSPAYCTWVVAYENDTNGWIRTPVMSNGVSGISFWVRGNGGGNNFFQVEISPNGTSSWSIAGIPLSHNGTTYGNYYVSINTSTKTYVRIRKTGNDFAGLQMLVDDIGVYLPSASVQFSNVMTHPGYPSSSDTVDVSCFIDSANPISAAMDIKAYLYYKEDSEGSFNGPIEMVRDGNYYLTLDPIPAHVAGDIVQYYIKSTFAGYFRDARSDMSPSYYPTGIPESGTNYYFDPPTNGFPSYNVRWFLSKYDHLEVNLGSSSAEMALVGDNEWQAVLTVSDPSSNLVWTFDGLGYYADMTNSYSPSTISWGDNNQLRFTLPMSSVAQLGASNITIDAQSVGSGQVLMRFDPVSLSYVIKRCAYQDFNEWLADPTYFEESLGLADILTMTNYFDPDPVDDIYVTRDLVDRENFVTWPITNVYYPIPTATGAVPWIINRAFVFEDFYTNKSCKLMPAADLGAVWPSKVCITSIDLDGIQRVSFDYRCEFKEDYLAYYSLGSDWTNYAVDVEFRSTATSPMWPYHSIFARYQNPSNYYELRLIKYQRPGFNRVKQQLYRRTGGQPVYLTQSGEINGTLAVNTCKFIVTTNSNGSVYLEGYLNGIRRVTYLDANASRIRTPGTIAVLTKDSDIEVDNMRVDRTMIQRFLSWGGGYGSSTNAGWVIYNGESLNNAYARLYKATEITNNPGSYLSTPYVDYPIDQIRLNYYCYQTGGELSIYGSTNGIFWNPVPVDVISGITAGWHYNYLITSGLGNYRYFKFLNTSFNDSDVRVIVDEIFITDVGEIYNENFNAGVASNWIAPWGHWSATNQAYCRNGYAGPSIGFDIQYANTNNSSIWGPDNESSWTTKVSVVASNLGFASTICTFDLWDDHFVRIKHTSGDASLILDEIELRSWRARPYATNGWSGHDTWIGERGPSSDHTMEFWRSRADPAQTQYVLSPVLTNGIGSINFDMRAINPPVVFEVQVAVAPLTNNFSVVDTFTNNDVAWSAYGRTLNTAADPSYVRIVHTSTGTNAILVIDKIAITDAVERDETMWAAYNALITHSQDSIEFEQGIDKKSCYLNNSPTAGTRVGISYTNDLAYVQTPYMLPGIGEVSFWYRNWEASGSPSASIYIRGAKDWTTPPEQWTNLLEITAIADTTYQHFVTNLYFDDLNYLRVYSSNSPRARVCIDNLLVAEPVGANFDIVNVKLSPEQPLSTNSVGISFDITGFLLSPEIDASTAMRLYWYTGTNSWGNVAETNMSWVPLVLSASNQTAMSFQAESPSLIPPYDIDTVVQYHIRATYGGLFSERTSPKRHKVFTNPSWYYPRDLNVEMNNGKQETNTTPYYFSYSCSPGDVWINEFNVIDGYSILTYTNQYVELCGRSTSVISNWYIEPLTPAFVSLGQYHITNNGTLGDETNGYGFWLLGSNGVTGIDMLLTNAMSEEGGILLVRSMGAYEHAICFGYTAGAKNMTNSYPFVYVGFDDDFEDYPVFLSGTGSNIADFVWNNNPGPYTPGSENTGQTLVDWRNAVPPFVGILITDFWMNSTNIYVTFVATNGLTPAPWYSTNVLGGSWTEITTNNFTESSGVYTQWFDIQTNSSTYYYKIKAP